MKRTSTKQSTTRWPAILVFAGPILFFLFVSWASAAAPDKVILTPKPPPQPRINGPRLFGVRPGQPFLYRIPCTGARPLTFAVDDLPEGMRVDTTSGIISGRAPRDSGRHAVKLRAENAVGAAEKAFEIVVGETLALTPPMGWNSWYIHYDRVTEQHLRHAADTMIESGMADF